MTVTCNCLGQASVSTTVAQVASEKSKIFNVQPQSFAVSWTGSFPSPQHFWTEQSHGYMNQIGHVMYALYGSWQYIHYEFKCLTSPKCSNNKLAFTTNYDWTNLAAVVLMEERHNCSFMNWCFPGRSTNHMFRYPIGYVYNIYSPTSRWFVW